MGKKKYFLVIGILLLAGFLSFSLRGISEEKIPITVYKSPSCGCCVGYSGELGRNGFDVDVVGIDDMQDIKDKYGVPASVESCHTSIVGDYFVEGHVPIEVVNKLLEDKPNIDGIALPNMPSGAPGMPGQKRGEWIIYSVKDGETEEFMRI